MKKVILLEKIAENGKPATWKAEINSNIVTYTWGYNDGKQQTETITFDEGKNIGRANQTTPEEQCLLEVMKKARKKLEKNYRLISGELTEASNEYIEPDYEVPLPMLADKYKKQIKKVNSYDKVFCQEKLDGNRCIISRVTKKMYSRTRKEIKHFPHIIEETIKATKSLPKEIEWVDGELFATGITFNGLQSIIRSAKNVDEKISKRMHYHIFDVISDKPWSERREYVSMIEKSYVIRPVKDYLISPSQLEEYHDKFVENGAEGIILRLPDKGYANKRTSALIKYKHFFDEEYLTVGFTCEKNHKDLLGAITLKLNKDSDVTFNARPSTTDEELKYIWEHKDEYIGKMATIRYQEKDKESNIPRFGILKGWKCESDLDLD